MRALRDTLLDAAAQSIHDTAAIAAEIDRADANLADRLDRLIAPCAFPVSLPPRLGGKKALIRRRPQQITMTTPGHELSHLREERIGHGFPQGERSEAFVEFHGATGQRDSASSKCEAWPQSVPQTG